MKGANPMTRREALQLLGNGFGMIGLARVLHAEASRTPLAPKAPHFAPKAQNVIFLFLNGGISQVDTFDPKPMLTKHDGEPMPGPKIKTDRASGNLMRSPFQFKKCGQSGLEVSEIFPRVGSMIDDFCVIRSTFTDIGNHPAGLLMMNCGHTQLGHPSMGSWLTYGLGTENQNLPGFVVLCPGYPTLGAELWSSAFLPSVYQGTYIPNQEQDPLKMVQNIRNTDLTPAEQRQQLDLIDKLNRSYLRQLGHQTELESHIQAMEVAFRMQTEVPEVFDTSKETEATRARYGNSHFGRGCLMALRMIEKGVRIVEVYFGGGQPWDSHDDILVHRQLARDADPAISALIQDLKSRGLFDQTIVLVGSEFGRTPMIQNSGLEKVCYGRDHNPPAFTTLLAGGGFKGGMAYGGTDDFGFKAVEKPVHVHDLHATILHQLGIDHTQLTYRYSGRDFRLTDVAGNVIREIIV
ncbi:MAG: DUF1501 domain-containing protein [Acidobacteria bacterium]|nr:MAG: DUF1501 domain-containing protein [Acidobacteriota bacterium]